MFIRMYKHIEWLLFKSPLCTRYLERVRTREEFEVLVGQIKPSEFLFYRTLAEPKRVENRALLDYLRFDLVGKRCLDIGPGHGESLDVWHERGAMECAYIEFEGFLFHHNRLKPFAKGWRLDHLKNLGALPSGHFDLIWSRGSFSQATFRGDGRRRFVQWLSQVEGLAAPKATVLLCPYWVVVGHKRQVANPKTHWIGQVLEERGYRALPFIEDHNQEPAYPITWVRSDTTERNIKEPPSPVSFDSLGRERERSQCSPGGER
jgi:hypothetical protein